MSDGCKPAEVDLLVVITRLHAERGASNDEFEQGWAAPNPAKGLGGVVESPNGEHGYWVLSEDCKAGVLVIHGYKGLIGKKTCSFEDVLIRHIDNSGLKACSFSNLAILKHGDILEPGATGTPKITYSSFLLECQELTRRFPSGQMMDDYNLRGKLPAALEVPRTLRGKGIGKKICDLTETLFRIGPAVELIVRSMQHIILEVRLWCDLGANNMEKADIIKEPLSDCHYRLTGADHWSNVHLRNALDLLCGIQVLDSYLKHPSAKLFRQDDEDPLKASFQDLYERQGGSEYLDCEERVLEALCLFLTKGQPPDFSSRAPENQVANIDQGLRVLSARLEALIPAALAADQAREEAS